MSADDTAFAFAGAVLDRLTGGQPLDDLGLDVVDGRVDLRGLRPPRQVVMLTGVRVEGLDLRGADIPSWRFDGCVVQDCRFDRAQCWDWRLWRSQVRRCRFAGAPDAVRRPELAPVRTAARPRLAEGPTRR